MIPEAALNAKVGELLTTLYKKRLAALEGLSLTTLLQKNPYLYRALGASEPFELIDQMLAARISSSDETIFGNDFFEPLAVFAAQKGQGAGVSVTVGAGAGQDIAIETANAYLAISVKSGTNIFNSQSEKGQSVEFKQLQARLKKLGKMFRPIIGYGYGRKNPRKASEVERLAGQVFWQLLSGEEDFYLRISRAMESFALHHAAEYKDLLQRRRSVLTNEFMNAFMGPDGRIDWDAVVAFSSSAAAPAHARAPRAPRPS